MRSEKHSIKTAPMAKVGRLQDAYANVDIDSMIDAMCKK